MSDVAAYPVLVCALFPVQGVMWTAQQWKCFNVNTFRLIYDTQLVHLLVYNTQYKFGFSAVFVWVAEVYIGSGVILFGC